MFQFSQTLVKLDATQSLFPTLVVGVNTPKVTVTPGNEDDHNRTTSRRGSCVTRQEAYEVDDRGEQQKKHDQCHSNNTHETAIE